MSEVTSSFLIPSQFQQRASAAFALFFLLRGQQCFVLGLKASAEQGCQIFLRTTYQNIPKRGKLNQTTTTYTKWSQTVPNGRKIDQMAIKYTNIFHCKPLKKLPKFGLLV
jgi:hypothetical protein